MVKLRGGIVWSGASVISRSDWAGLHFRDRYFLFMRYRVGGWEVEVSVFWACICLLGLFLSAHSGNVSNVYVMALRSSLGLIVQIRINEVQKRRLWVAMVIDGGYG